MVHHCRCLTFAQLFDQISTFSVCEVGYWVLVLVQPKSSLHVSAFFVQTQIIGYFLIPHVTFLGESCIGIGIF